jgi:Zn-dependent protease with chaperone function
MKKNIPLYRFILRIAVTIWNSLFTFLVMLGFTLLALDLLTAGRGFLATVEELEFVAILLIIAIVGSPLLVLFYDLERVTEENGADLLKIYSRPEFFAVFKPRLVIARGMPGPNAFAAGIWPFSYIAVTNELLSQVRGNTSPLNEDHLEAILLHEMAHH